MKVDLLVPALAGSETFRRSRLKFIPETSGCYVLTTFEKDVLYVGLTVNLRRRVNEHLESKTKTACTVHGRAIFVHWLESREINKIERTWMNIHINAEGLLPILNNAYSPTST